MKRRLRTFSVLMGIGVGFFFLFITAKSTQSEEKKSEALKEMPIFISASGLFKDLERPPVQFYHDKHTAALKEEGCGICHPENKNKNIKGKYVYTYPKVRDEASKEALMDSYHQNCLECHNKRIKEGKKAGAVTCGGCHHLMKSGLTEASCNVCHSGPMEKTGAVQTLSAPVELLPDKLDEEMTISVLEKDYKPSKFPHLSIIRKLTDVSNLNRLARYFHTQQMTICMGCHHLSPMEQKKPLPSCNACHSNRMEPRKGVPTLFGAYHRQCIGCHEQMDLKIKPRDCSKCHEKKVTAEPPTAKK